jgi:hypothetical protein
MKTLFNRCLARVAHACARYIHALLPLAVVAVIALDAALICGARP